MQTFEFRRGLAGKRMRVEVGENGLSVALGAKAQSIDFDELTEVRWLHTASPQRVDFGLVLKSAKERIIINANSRAAMADQEALADAAAAALFAINRKRPDLDLTVGASPAAAWGLFACYAVPAVLGLLFGLIVIGEPDAFLYGVVPLFVGVLSAIAAWNARPWRKPARHSMADFAAQLAAPAASG